jgi:creatinine amidohydrolase/Fe(II)-dependent formamide hydrolase-like protein
MRYEMMFPQQIRQAIDENWPVVLPIGVLEYHSEHCVVGVDTVLVVRAVEILEKEIDMVILPPFHYGAASHVVEPPERNGTVHINSDVLHQFAKQLFSNLLRIGFRNMHCFIHHQSENFSAGMPTDLAFKFAARQSLFEFIEKERGENWWGSEETANYYSEHESGIDPFNWIQLHPFMDAETQQKYPIDHAAKQETSLMLAFVPEGVDMDKLSDKKWYAREASKANIEYGNAAKEMILNSMRKILKGR